VSPRAKVGKVGTVAPRAVVVSRPTAYEALRARHGTREQARFFLAGRGVAIEEVEGRHARHEAALQAVSAGVPLRWRRSRVDRADLDRFLFGPEDVVIVVGQDGLVANVAKYLAGQPVVGINPDPGLNDGVLARHQPGAIGELLRAVAAGRAALEPRTMVEARLDDGQRLLALNEIFVGHGTHQSARYRIGFGEVDEEQSSSGVIVSTGTGATGWARSIARQKQRAPRLPAPTEPALVFFVREPFPSRATGTSLEQGRLGVGQALTVRSEMNEAGTVFGDGIEDDHLDFAWGMRLEARIAPERLNLVAA
jgi:NAD kinase